jgi:CRP-like cAMP-binding protein
MAMLIEHDYAVTVVARTSVRALKISRQAMLRLMAEDPDLAQHFVDRIATRLTRLAVELRRIDQMLALAAEPPSLRV